MADANNLCFEALQMAKACIDEDSGSCDCFDDDFITEFPKQVEAAFELAIDGNDPSNPDYCPQVESSACEFLQASASCCCHHKTAAYAACRYGSDLIATSGVFESTCAGEDVAIVSCTIEPEETNQYGKLIVWGVIASVVLFLLSLFCSFCLSQRKRRKRKRTKERGSIDVNISSAGNVSKNVTKKSHDYRSALYRHQKITKEADGDNSLCDINEETLRAVRSFDWSRFNQDPESGRPPTTSEEDLGSDRVKDKRRNQRASSRQTLLTCQNEDDGFSKSSNRSRRKKEKMKLLEFPQREASVERKENLRRPTRKKIRTADRSTSKENEVSQELTPADTELTQAVPLVSIVSQFRRLLGYMEEDQNMLERSIQNVTDERKRLTKDLESSEKDNRANMENSAMKKDGAQNDEDMDTYAPHGTLTEDQDNVILLLPPSLPDGHLVQDGETAISKVYTGSEEVLDIQDETMSETSGGDSSSKEDDIAENQSSSSARHISGDYIAREQQLALMREELELSNKVLRNKLKLSMNENRSLHYSLCNKLPGRRPQSPMDDNKQGYEWQASIYNAQAAQYVHTWNTTGLDYLPVGAQSPMHQPRTSHVPMPDQVCETQSTYDERPISMFQAREIDWDEVSDLSMSLRTASITSATISSRQQSPVTSDIDPPGRSTPRKATQVPPTKNVRELLYHRNLGS
eukprot:scaffold6749_cov113-Cylindrotheca_fusiformis.AAC.8